MSSESPDSVVDTVVLRYFLLADEIDLLVELLGSPLGVPRIIFDPDEEDVPAAARSEIGRSVAYQQAASRDPARDEEARATALRNATRLAGVTELHAAGRIVTLDLTDAELESVGRLTSPTGCAAFGLTFPLDAGEAACVAMAVARNLPLATDDGDALRALHALAPRHPYERIRKLLVRAATGGRVTRRRANEIHDEMRRLGFWDSHAPFPREGLG
ncbi:MAG: hypothetical protein AB1679_23645 [Actinomycetota bacterium]